jgi:hypothetical protein
MLEIAGGIGAGVAGLGVLAGYSTLKKGVSENRDPRVPTGLARAREQAAQEVTNLYQNNPNSREFQTAVIRLKQIDEQIAQLSGGAQSNAPPPPSYKPPRLAQ